MRAILKLVYCATGLIVASGGLAQAGPCGFRQEIAPLKGQDASGEARTGGILDVPSFLGESRPRADIPTIGGNRLVDSKAASTREEGC